MVVLALVCAGCTATTTTTTTASGTDATTGASESDQAAPAPTAEPPAGCPYFSADLLPQLQAGIDAVLSGTSPDPSISDPCVHRFVNGGDWVEVRFVPADESVAMFGDANLMTNGVDRTRATTADGVLVDVVASASSPQSISTWDASLVGASLLGG